MAHLGERLRDQRLAAGIELASISEKTKISTRYLEALEKGDWKQLPGSVFARNFARQYAVAVGLTEEQIKPDLETIFPTEEALPPVQTKAQAAGIQVKPLTPGAFDPAWTRLPKPALSLAAVLALCSIVYMGWQRFILRSHGATETASTPYLPPSKLTVPAPAASNSSATVAPPAKPQQTVPLANATANTAPLPGPPTPATGGTMVELSAPPGTTGGMAVRVAATQESWVSVTANGKRLFEGILQPNDVRVFKSVETGRIIVGNAGGIEIQTDGRSLGPIGQSGQVRVIVISPQGSQILTTQKTGDDAASSRI
ncbi:MAG: DUF4115 domain-containing protein [Bryobacteraceae bacterium]